MENKMVKTRVQQDQKRDVVVCCSLLLFTFINIQFSLASILRIYVYELRTYVHILNGHHARRYFFLTAPGTNTLNYTYL